MRKIVWLQAYQTYKLGGKISELLYSPAAYGIDLSSKDMPKPSELSECSPKDRSRSWVPSASSHWYGHLGRACTEGSLLLGLPECLRMSKCLVWLLRLYMRGIVCMQGRVQTP